MCSPTLALGHYSSLLMQSIPFSESCCSDTAYHAAYLSQVQGSPSGQGQTFVDVEKDFSIRSLCCGVTFSLMSTNSVLRPDGPPCIVSDVIRRSPGYADLSGRVLMRTGQSAVLICGGRRSGGGEAIDTCYEKQGWKEYFSVSPPSVHTSCGPNWGPLLTMVIRD